MNSSKMIPFKIVKYTNGKYRIESIVIGYMFRDDLNFDNVLYEELIDKMEKISVILSKEKMIAVFYMD